MALRPAMMLLASCWALLAISQDASGVPAGSERIATQSNNQTHQQICDVAIDGAKCLRGKSTVGPVNDPRLADPRTNGISRQIKIASVAREPSTDVPSVVKPKIKPDVTPVAPIRKKVKRKSESSHEAEESSEDKRLTRSLKIVTVAKKYLGLGERSDRRTLSNMFAENLDQRIDPVRTPWCAAFINAVLAEAGLPTSGSNMGISFADYGTKVNKPQVGDIVVIRGGRNSRTHVGIFVGTEMRGSKQYIKLLGGNQSNQVRIASYPASKIIAIRRAG